MALRRLRKRPVRTFLLLQGTVWGVAVAIFPSAVVQGTREAVRLEGARLGADRIAVAADPTASRKVVLERRDLDALDADLRFAGTEIHALGGVRVLQHVHVGVPFFDGTKLTILAATPDAARARGLELAAGRWLQPGDGPECCVVEGGVGDALRYEGTPAHVAVDGEIVPGARIRLVGRQLPLEVVGVARERDADVLRTDDLGFDHEHPVYRQLTGGFLLAMGLPLVRDEWKRSDRCIYVPAPADDPAFELDWLFVRVEPRAVSDTARRVREALARREKATLTLYPLVLPVVMGDRIDRFGAVNLAMFLACLVMGAVVMANLGLLAVLSRAREIAVRRVEGATRGDIARHFLAEGLLLAVAGSALGCVLGVALAALRIELQPTLGLTWTFPTLEASAAVFIALIVGLMASTLPALRASRQDPVKGLADE